MYSFRALAKMSAADPYEHLQWRVSISNDEP